MRKRSPIEPTIQRVLGDPPMDVGVLHVAKHKYKETTA